LISLKATFDLAGPYVGKLHLSIELSTIIHFCINQENYFLDDRFASRSGHKSASRTGGQPVPAAPGDAVA
jgi:hypothetical protein